MDFMEALSLINQRVPVSCVVDGGDPVIYRVVNEELTINGRIEDYRNFCFSPSQILFGKWTILDEEGETDQ